ncbi:hypothetical protein CKO37_12125 [Rubrivivax gelatinosus]|nr:hypothetical protein [Rubrivivax gelatinosus]
MCVADRPACRRAARCFAERPPMSDAPTLAAKVLLLEHDPRHYQTLWDFAQSLGLVVLPRSATDALPTLSQHKDLGGVMLAEDLPCESGGALDLAVAIHRLRPELPIFLRRTGDTPLAEAQARAASHPWTELDTLREAVECSLFSLRYPTELVNGVVELTAGAIRSMFPHAQVDNEPPYVVHDRIIFGQVSTLIALESTWCRGYMMLQTEESALRQGMLQGFGYEGVGGDLNFRELNHLLGETTNLIWGAFKNRYIPPEAFANEQTQVPIVINHEQKYISFGSQDPQLCVRYKLSDPRRPGLPPLIIVQRLIFNLLWSPERFTEYASPGDKPGGTGELELF